MACFIPLPKYEALKIFAFVILYFYNFFQVGIKKKKIELLERKRTFLILGENPPDV